MNAAQRRKQRRATIRKIKQRISEDEFQGVFTSHQYIDNSGYVDFCFIGKYNGVETFWNACMTTTAGDYYDFVHDKALETAYEKFPLSSDDDPFNFEPHDIDDKGKVTSWVMAPHSDEIEHAINDRYRWMSEYTIELLNTKRYSIPTERIEIDTSYKWGTGLHIRVNKSTINPQDIYEFIEKFNEHSVEFTSNETTSLTAEELGVTLNPGDRFIRWTKDRFSHDTVAINIDKL